MKNTLIVNFFAGPGAGKSTTAAGVYSILKLNGIDCELVTEYAKKLTWEGRQEALADQIYVTSKQYHYVYPLIGKVDVVLCDSPILLGLVYGNGTQKYKEFVVDLFSKMENRNYFVERDKKYNVNGRNQNYIEALEKDQEIKEMLEFYKIESYNIKSNYKDINKVVVDIMSELNMKPKDFKFWITERIEE